MPTYTTIPDSTIAPEAPVTSELMTLLRDNPIATTEGDTGAPRVKGRALDVVLNDTDANIPTGGSATTVLVTNTTLTNLSYVMVTGFADLGNPSSSTSLSLNYQTTTDGGSNWTGNTTFLDTGTYSSDSVRPFSVVVDVSGSTDGIRVRSVNGSNFANSDVHISILSLGGS